MGVMAHSGLRSKHIRIRKGAVAGPGMG